MRPPINRPPDPLSNEAWEEVVRQTAGTLPYPATPNVADAVRTRLAEEGRRKAQPSNQRRWQPVWVVGIILALLIGLWSVPPLRAAILEFLQIGAVRIWLVEPTPTPLLTSTPVSAGAAPVDEPSPTPRPTATPLSSLFNLAGRTTLAEAEAMAGFHVPLPTYPSGVGAPDGVFYQDMDGPAVVLVWIEPEQPDKAKFSLTILSNDALVHKGLPPVMETTTVNGEPAMWTNGPYILAYGSQGQPEWMTRYLVSGQVLIWEEDGLTYRLESELTLEEAIRMAESLE